MTNQQVLYHLTIIKKGLRSRCDVFNDVGVQLLKQLGKEYDQESTKRTHQYNFGYSDGLDYACSMLQNELCYTNYITNQGNNEPQTLVV